MKINLYFWGGYKAVWLKLLRWVGKTIKLFLFIFILFLSLKFPTTPIRRRVCGM